MRVVFIERGDFSPGKPLVRPDSNYISSSSFFRAFSPFPLPLPFSLSVPPPPPPPPTQRIGATNYTSREPYLKSFSFAPRRNKPSQTRRSIDEAHSFVTMKPPRRRGDSEFSSGECFSPPPPPFPPLPPHTHSVSS